MKTKFIFSICMVMFLCGTFNTVAQKKKDKLKVEKQLDKAIKQMYKDAKPKLPVKCGSEKPRILAPSSNANNIQDLTWELRKAIKDWNKYAFIDKKFMATNFDHIILAFKKGEPLAQFEAKIVDKKFLPLNKKRKANLQEIYTFMKFLTQDDGFPIYYLDTQSDHKGCFQEAYVKIQLLKKNASGVTWGVRAGINIGCNCKDIKVTSKIKHLKYEYTAEVKGQLRSDKISFEGPKKSAFKLISYVCCPDAEKPKVEDSSMEVAPTENISLPDQTIGGSIGVGFSENFKETNFCIGGEYLNNIQEIGQSSLFVGANAFAETSNFMDVSSTFIRIGPTVQLFTPITQSHETQITNGISGNYILGTTSNNGIKDKVNGWNISLNTGFNIQLTSNISISVIIPVIAHQSLTYKPKEGGASFKTENTSVFLNKNNPTRLGLRFGF